MVKRIIYLLFFVLWASPAFALLIVSMVYYGLCKMIEWIRFGELADDLDNEPFGKLANWACDVPYKLFGYKP